MSNDTNARDRASMKIVLSHRYRPAENLHEILERCFVVWVDENQILREQQSDHVVAVFGEHRNPAESALENHRQRLQSSTVEHDVKHACVKGDMAKVDGSLEGGTCDFTNLSACFDQTVIITTHSTVCI